MYCIIIIYSIVIYILSDEWWQREHIGELGSMYSLAVLWPQQPHNTELNVCINIPLAIHINR